MNNPLGVVKHTRTTYSRSQQSSVTEVLVQFNDEPPAWIPLQTLLALQKERQQ